MSWFLLSKIPNSNIIRIRQMFLQGYINENILFCVPDYGLSDKQAQVTLYLPGYLILKLASFFSVSLLPGPIAPSFSRLPECRMYLLGWLADSNATNLKYFVLQFQFRISNFEFNKLFLSFVLQKISLIISF